MPVQRNRDGSWSTGLDPNKVPEYAGKTPRLFIDRPMPSLPKNPLLKVIASRKMRRDPVTGVLSEPSATFVAPLYRPGGLLYRQDTGR